MCPDRNPLGQVEDIHHFLYVCQLYNELRAVWLRKLTLPPNFLMLENNFQLNEVLNIASNIRHTAKFIIASFSIKEVKKL